MFFACLHEKQLPKNYFTRKINVFSCLAIQRLYNKVWLGRHCNETTSVIWLVSNKVFLLLSGKTSSNRSLNNFLYRTKPVLTTYSCSLLPRNSASFIDPETSLELEVLKSWSIVCKKITTHKFHPISLGTLIWNYNPWQIFYLLLQTQVILPWLIFHKLWKISVRP